jgi:prepilin-type N-terminal cleavage/methylation domain-containing protein
MKTRLLRLPIGRTNGAAGRSEQGFTLLELLVALAILAAGLGLVLAAFSQALDRSRQEEEQSAAQALESSLLAQALARTGPDLNEIDGRAGAFHWHVRSVPFGTADDRNAWNENAAEVTVTVSWRRDGKLRQIAVRSLRLSAKVSP